MNTEQIKEFGECRIGGIEIITIIGEIEGHEGSSGTAKTTKYEHLLPMLAAYDENSEIQGILFILNTIGGDVSCGLALAEMISGLKTPTASFIIGDSHSIGLPLSVAADQTVIAPSATVIIHPVRMNGPILGAPQTYEYFQLIQERITGFISSHTGVSQQKIQEWMVKPGILSRDLGTIFVGQEAVDAGLFQRVGGIKDALEQLKEQIRQREKQAENR